MKSQGLKGAPDLTVEFAVREEPFWSPGRTDLLLPLQLCRTRYRNHYSGLTRVAPSSTVACDGRMTRPVDGGAEADHPGRIPSRRHHRPRVLRHLPNVEIRSTPTMPKSDQFRSLARAAGLPAIRLHDARHTCGTLTPLRGLRAACQRPVRGPRWWPGESPRSEVVQLLVTGVAPFARAWRMR